MLMRLGRWLRLAGMNVANPGYANDPELMLLAKQENRVLITRDRKLADACRVSGIGCILIKSTRLQDQLKEMARLGVKLELNPKRCTICNCQLQETYGEKNLNSPIQDKTWKCVGCGKLYWAGSHWKKIEETLKKIR